jgi:hypothetical protein
MWSSLGKKHYVDDASFASVAPLPKGDETKVDEMLEAGEDYILRVKDDISSILKLLKKDKAEKIELFVAAGWKRKLRGIASQEKKFDAAMKVAMADAEIKPHASEVAKVLTSYMKNASALGETASEEFELAALESGKKLLADEFGAEVAFSKEEGSSAPKAKNALPGKPSILVS